jgi:hypothetical protein
VTFNHGVVGSIPTGLTREINDFTALFQPPCFPGIDNGKHMGSGLQWGRNAMPNQFVLQRLAGIQQVLMGVHRSGAPMSAASRGTERQTFVESFLANVLPPIYRFGSGDATDAAGHRSGQLDVVVEYPFSPSLPSFGGIPTTRLYLAESVAAVVEVKSNIAAQWDEARHTAAQLAPLRRSFKSVMTFG